MQDLEIRDRECAVGVRPRGQQRADNQLARIFALNSGDRALVDDGRAEASLNPRAKAVLNGLGVSLDGMIGLVLDMEGERRVETEIMPVGLRRERAPCRWHAMASDDRQLICRDLERVHTLEVGGLA